MIKPTLPNALHKKIYVLDRHCLCGEPFVQQIMMQYGSVLTFPISVVWFFGHRQEQMQESMTYLCQHCGQGHIAWKPEDVPFVEWDEKYVQRCKALGVWIDMENDGAVEWPVMQREEAMRVANGMMERYGKSEMGWYKAWVDNPKTIHHVLDKDGNVVADAVYYTNDGMPLQRKQDITVYLDEESEGYDWKG